MTGKVFLFQLKPRLIAKIIIKVFLKNQFSKMPSVLQRQDFSKLNPQNNSNRLSGDPFRKNLSLNRANKFHNTPNPLISVLLHKIP